MRAAVSLEAHTDRAATRPGGKRTDPPPPLFLIKGGKLELPPEEMAEEAVLDITKPELAATPAAPLAAESTAPAPRSRKWLAAVVASCLFHAGVAGLFLHFREDIVKLAGADEAGVSMAGNVAEDQAAAGELDPATNVTIIPMIRAEAVEANETEQAQPVETAVPAEVVETPTAEPIEPTEEAAVEPVRPVEPLPQPAVEPLLEPPAEALAEEAPSTDVAEPAPQVLATDRAEPVEDDNIVPPVEVKAPAEEAIIQPTEESIEPEDEATEEIARQLAQIEDIPVPARRPERPETRTSQARAEPAKAPAARKRDTERSSGAGGRNQANARRGSADGAEKGNTAVASRGSRQNTAAGNAAVSNYPGRIVSELRRALRYPAAAKRQRLRGEVHVAFTVSGSGAVSSVRVVRSSGAAVLDQAAVETVRRAAPFPPIPAEAGRSNWPFTVPLAFTR